MMNVLLVIYRVDLLIQDINRVTRKEKKWWTTDPICTMSAPRTAQFQALQMRSKGSLLCGKILVQVIYTSVWILNTQLLYSICVRNFSYNWETEGFIFLLREFETSMNRENKCEYEVIDTHKLLGLVKCYNLINAVQPIEIHILEKILKKNDSKCRPDGLWNLGDLFPQCQPFPSNMNPLLSTKLNHTDHAGITSDLFP